MNKFKCWCCSLLDDFEPATVKAYLMAFKSFVRVTKGVSEFNIEKVLPKFYIEVKTNQINLIVAVSNLIDYDETFFGENSSLILKLLMELNSFVEKEYQVKKIPSTFDFLTLDNVITDYFNSNLTKDEYIKWSCINIWWKITTIIPMRISEFCLLEKDRVYKKGDKCYILINRVKTAAGQTERETTEVIIPEPYYLDIKNYIRITEKMDSNCNTIFSRNVLGNYFYKVKRTFQIPDFSAGFFRKTLLAFYIDIVDKKYGYTQYKDKHTQVFPNDTRHLAFINLKLQGIHPIIVANLGGHKNIKTQEHYFSHASNLNDLELFGLFNCFKYNKIRSFKKDFVDEKILMPNNEDFKIKLKIGYCTDPNMDCKVNSCFECDFWRVHLEEMMENKADLYDEITKIKKNFEFLYSNLESIFIDIQKVIKNKVDINNKINIVEDKRKLEAASVDLNNSLFYYLELNKFLEKVNKNEKAL